MGKVEGKVAVITGAASGMGYRHVERFIEEGAKVVVTDIAVEAGQALADKMGENAHFIKLDVASAADWARVVEETEAVFGPIDILVNNAGMGIFKWFEKLTEAEFRKVLDVNTVSIFLSLQAVAPSMRKKGGGSVVNISSVDGLRGAPRSMAYCASKFAVNGITRVAALELGRDNIRVNTVHPGVIKTPLADDGAAFIQQIKERILLKRLGTTDEASNMVLFLASDESSFCTGAEFILDGGQIACL